MNKEFIYLKTNKQHHTLKKNLNIPSQLILGLKSVLEKL